ADLSETPEDTKTLRATIPQGGQRITRSENKYTYSLTTTPRNLGIKNLEPAPVFVRIVTDQGYAETDRVNFELDSDKRTRVSHFCISVPKTGAITVPLELMSFFAAKEDFTDYCGFELGEGRSFVPRIPPELQNLLDLFGA
ncbi:MAG TPA: hypothetical protein VJ044_00275, partial [Candidatus Hodarchaeales archaeon]|nr:hypothetical protein [Candidatus Hodarchaeales archaeon]